MRNNAAVFLSGRLTSLVVLLGFQILVVRLLPIPEYARFALVFAWATLMQTVISFGIPRLIPKYVGQAGTGLWPSAVRRLVISILSFRVVGSALAIMVAYWIATRFGLAETVDPQFLLAASAYILISLVQVDADAIAQSLGLQRVSRAALIGEALLRLILVAASALAGAGTSAANILAIASLTGFIASGYLIAHVLRALRQLPKGDTVQRLNRREFLATGTSGYASALAWFASSPAIVRLIAGRVLETLAFAGFSFTQTLAMSFQRYTPGMLLFPFVEPAVMRHYAKSGDQSRLEAVLSVVTKADMIAIGAAIVGTVVSGQAIIGLMTGGRYAAAATALPWLLGYLLTSSAYRAFEIVAVALNAASALFRTLTLSLVWLGAALLLAPHFGLIILLLCPVGDSLSRLWLMYTALRRRGIRKVVDLRIAATVSLLATFCAGAGVWISHQLRPTPVNIIGVGIAAGSAFLLLVFLVRPLRKHEADVIIGDRTGEFAAYLARYARA